MTKEEGKLIKKTKMRGKNWKLLKEEKQKKLIKKKRRKRRRNSVVNLRNRQVYKQF